MFPSWVAFRVTFIEKSKIGTNGLPKMLPKLWPQQHFDMARCNGIAHVTVARVSCMSVCKMSPKLKPQLHFEVAKLRGAHVEKDKKEHRFGIGYKKRTILLVHVVNNYVLFLWDSHRAILGLPESPFSTNRIVPKAQRGSEKFRNGSKQIIKKMSKWSHLEANLP